MAYPITASTVPFCSAGIGGDKRPQPALWAMDWGRTLSMAGSSPAALAAPAWAAWSASASRARESSTKMVEPTSAPLVSSSVEPNKGLLNGSAPNDPGYGEYHLNAGLVTVPIGTAIGGLMTVGAAGTGIFTQTGGTAIFGQNCALAVKLAREGRSRRETVKPIRPDSRDL